MIEFEARLAADPALAAEYARLVALREAIAQARAATQRARRLARARACNGGSRRTPREACAPRRGASRRDMARSPPRCFSASCSAPAATGFFAAVPSDDPIERAVVAGYVRGRLVGQPVDIASSDRHTVKPWFAGKIAWRDDGARSQGGRVSRWSAAGSTSSAQTPVPTLVYQRREHQIALSEMPGTGRRHRARRAPRRATATQLVEWKDRGRRYVAVSDMPPGEVDAFAAAFRRAADAEREEPPPAKP